MELILCLIIPAIVSGQITVQIKATGSEDSSTVNANGYILELITELDRQAFGLTDESLQQAVEVISGVKPEELFVKNAMLYLENGWAPVTRRLEPTHSVITNIESKPVLIEKEFSNNGSMADYFNVVISPEISDSVFSSWIEKYDSNVGQPIGYEVVMGHNGEGSVGYAASWGEGGIHSSPMKIGPADIPLLLEAGGSVLATLSVTENVMAADIEYNATLAGSVTYKYGAVTDRIDVNEVTKALGLPLSLKSHENLMITFYSDARLTVQESRTGTVLLDVPVDIYPQ